MIKFCENKLYEFGMKLKTFKALWSALETNTASVYIGVLFYWYIILFFIVLKFSFHLKDYTEKETVVGIPSCPH